MHVPDCRRQMPDPVEGHSDGHPLLMLVFNDLLQAQALDILHDQHSTTVWLLKIIVELRYVFTRKLFHTDNFLVNSFFLNTPSVIAVVDLKGYALGCGLMRGQLDHAERAAAQLTQDFEFV